MVSDEEIDGLALTLKINHQYDAQYLRDAADMLLALQARAEAAEKERDEFRRALDRGLPPTVEAQSEINHWRERTEAAEKLNDELRLALTKAAASLVALEVRTEAAEKRVAELEAAKHTVFAIPLREPPAILVTVGDRWLNADSGTVYEWDGTAWVQVRSDG